MIFLLLPIVLGLTALVYDRPDEDCPECLYGEYQDDLGSVPERELFAPRVQFAPKGPYTAD